VPLIPLFAALLLVVALILATPLLLFLRYRAGTARRRAWRWVATLNLVMIVLSAGFFLYAAALTNFWVRDAFRYSVFGLLGGCLLGLVGLASTRWEQTPRALHYTPNRWLVLFITLLVSGRVIYSFVQGAGAFGSAGVGPASVSSFGLAGSLAAAATVVGYYLSYGVVLRWRIGRWQRRRLM
jgi:hypothetical protein